MDGAEQLRRVRLEFYEEDIEQLDAILARFLEASQSKCALLVDKDGHLVTKKGFTQAFDTMSLAALVAGAFASTREVARLLGETEFSVMFHQGRNEHIHITLVTERALLVIVFDDRTTIGMVRLYAEDLGKRVAGIFERAQERAKTKAPRDLGDEFAEDAQDRLDEFFDEPTPSS